MIILRTDHTKNEVPMCRDDEMRTSIGSTPTKGKIFIVMGPSGVGKTTLVEAVLRSQAPWMRLTRVVTYTTRQPREGELQARDFHFVSQGTYDELAASGFFLEQSCAYHDCYGTAVSDVDATLAQGYSVVLVIDRPGAEQVVAKRPETTVIRIVPPSFEELERRLRLRGTHDEKTILFRLDRAKKEENSEQENPLATYTIENDDLIDSINRLMNVFSSVLQCSSNDFEAVAKKSFKKC